MCWTAASTSDRYFPLSRVLMCFRFGIGTDALPSACAIKYLKYAAMPREALQAADTASRVGTSRYTHAFEKQPDVAPGGDL